MPINVVCPGCHTRFTASDKFAGKQGPCPKCKFLITIPAADSDIKIHAPVDDNPKDAKGRSVLKPIAREEPQATPLSITLVVAAIVVSLVVAVALGIAFRPNGPPPAIAAAGLLLISGPLAAAGYTFLRDAELEPYRGRSLWLRAGLCGLIYAALWGGLALVLGYLPPGAANGHWTWLYLAPPFVLLGGISALAALDLDFGSGVMHYLFYVACTLLLRFAAGMPALWASAPGS
jgi:hypothetical protein